MLGLSESRFPQISLTAEEQRAYDELALALLQRTLAAFNAFSGVVDKTKWALVRKHKHMGVYKNIEGSQPPGTSLLLGAGFIAGSVDDVMNGLYCDETDELRTTKTLLRYKFIDGAVLHVSERRSEQHPYRFAGIKWAAAKAPLGSLVKDRDLLMYERMGETLDARGCSVAYNVYESVDRPEWPANTIKSIKRARTTTCYLYRQHAPGIVECFFSGEFMASGSVAQYVSDYAIAGKWLAVRNSVRCSEAKKLSQLIQSARTSTVSSSVYCYLCKADPPLFGSGHSPCAGCLQAVCKACAKERHIFQMNRRTGKPQTELFCVPCIRSVAFIDPDLKRPRRRDTISHTDSTSWQVSSSTSPLSRRDFNWSMPPGGTMRMTDDSIGSLGTDSEASFELLLDLTSARLEDSDGSDCFLSEDEC